MKYSSMSSGRWCWCWRRQWRTARHWRRLRVLLTELQCANVGDDGPTILNGNLCCVARHAAPAVGDRVEEVTNGRLAQAIVVERSSAAETPAHDHAVAISGQTMTNATENLVTLFSPNHSLFGDWKWESIYVIRVRVCG